MAAGISFDPPVSCLPTTSNVFPPSRSGSVSPTQRMGVSPAASAARTFRFTASSVSAKYCRRSEWPMMQWVAPASFSIRVDTSPVYAPSSAKWTFWDATPMPLPWTSCDTAPIDGYGGARTISTPRTPATSGRKALTKAPASPAVLYIFQLPAMTGTRIQLALETYFARSTRRQEYPHSLSYQASTFTIFPPITLVERASKEDEAGSWL